MGIFEFMKNAVRENLIVATACYGKGFWTLLLAMVMAVSFVFHMETSRARPVVERIPAAELSAYIK